MVLGPIEKYEKKSMMTKVLHVPKLTTNLFSTWAVTAKGNVVRFGHTLCWIKNSHGKVVARGCIAGNMYRLDCKVDTSGKQASVA